MMVAITSALSSKESFTSDKVLPSKSEMIEEKCDEPSFSDAEDFVDNIDDSELLEDVLKAKPNEREIIDAVVVVDGLPKVGEERVAKLKNVLHNIYSKIGKVLSEHYPEEPNPAEGDKIFTKGYCFVEFESKTVALEAVNVLNGYKLDKVHSFVVTLFRDFEKLQNIGDFHDWEAPKRRPYKDRGNLRSWLLNPDCLDQFVLQSESGDKVGIYWNGLTEPSKVTEKQHWSDSFVRWSPYGTYISTVHKQGVALWGGEKFEQIMKFMHNGAQYLDFSPCENYLVTYAPPKSKYTDVSDAVKVWAIRTGELKRAFSAFGDAVKRWPHFRWSFDDKYFATLGKEDTLCVYETETFGFVNKKSIKMDNIRDFQWSPSQHIIAYYVAEKGQTPGRVAIMPVPYTADLATKNMFYFADASIHWQKSGDNLCFKVDRYGKKKEDNGEIKYSNITIQLEIFHMRAKEYPISMLEIKEAVQAFAWEPVGTKFCLIQGDMRSSINFYSVKSNPVGVSHLKTMEHKGQFNTLCWSPHGQYVVCAGLKVSTGSCLMFIDCSQAEIAAMNVQEHPGVTDIEWDPTGRFVVSSVSTWSSGSSRAMDFGYVMWNFQGRMIARRPVDMFCSFAWRPRPPTLLPEAKAKEIKKNVKKYAAEFDEKDRRKLDKASQEVSEKRIKQMTEYKAWRDQHKQLFSSASEKAERAKLRYESDQGAEVAEETIEYLINQEEITIE